MSINKIGIISDRLTKKKVKFDQPDEESFHRGALKQKEHVLFQPITIKLDLVIKIKPI